MSEKDKEIEELKQRLKQLEDSDSSKVSGEASDKKESGCFTKAIQWIFIIVLFLWLFTAFSGNDDPPKSAKEIQEEKRKGFHCLSGWDGSHSQLVRSVKNNLRDPSSFEHVSTKIGPENNGQHFLMMTYRATNGFGGTNVESASGSIRNSDCGLIEWSSN